MDKTVRTALGHLAIMRTPSMQNHETARPIVLPVTKTKSIWDKFRLLYKEDPPEHGPSSEGRRASSFTDVDE